MLFTPLSYTFTRVATCHNINTMHLADHSRYVERYKGRYLTNKDQRGTLVTFYHMVLALLIISSLRRLETVQVDPNVSQTMAQSYTNILLLCPEKW